MEANMTKAKRDPFTAVDTVGDIQVYPMKWKDSQKVGKLFSKINIDWMIGNTVIPSVNIHGMVDLDEDGEVVLMEESRKALLELIKLATQLNEEQIDELTFIQIGNIVEEYMMLSMLKKKMTEQ
jgi:hypothetical protein